MTSAYLLQASGGGESEFCQLFGSDCSDVVNSGYGYFLGVPVSSFSLAYFSFQIAFLIFTRVIGAATGKKTIVLPLFLNMAAFSVSVYFLYILTVTLKEYCLLCLIVHGVNALTLLVNLAISRSRKFQYFYTAAPPTNINLLAVFFIPLFIASTLFFGVNYLSTREQLISERQNVRDNLDYAIFKYQQSTKHAFEVSEQDTVVGEPSIAVHQIILIYKEGCGHCRRAQEFFTTLVKDNDMAVYLILKNHKTFSEEKLKELSVVQVPAVFIDGQYAEGWELPGFMDPFAEDCGC